MSLSWTYFPYIEHRYVPLLRTSIHVPDTHLLLAVYYKALLFFFKLVKIFEKVQENKKNIKRQMGKDVIFGSSRLMSPSNRELYITSLGWVISLTLVVVLITLILSPPTG